MIKRLMVCAVMFPLQTFAHEGQSTVPPPTTSPPVTSPRVTTFTSSPTTKAIAKPTATANPTVTANPVVNNTITGVLPTSSGGSYGGRGGNSGAYHDNTPDIFLPSISGGNPCGLGTGVGGSGPGLSGLLTWMWEGSGCQRIEDAKIIHNLLHDDAAAKNRLCEGAKFRDAFAYAGHPCANESRTKEWEASWQQQGYHQRADGYWVK